MTWVRCECGCGWEGEDEVTQWLVQEAVAVKDSREAARELARTPEDDAADLLMARHAEMLKLRDKQRATDGVL